ncbi:cation diffusion facilitator family transporter [Holdemania massiliensis]|uniref:cation diffusion facilitator family transporter n=1 Tax=Holdemania massiliensis TaxID=1468449 RepID=UPI001F069958|nr:cation diffusion facilitator family transporter [Holdemania massiliensis]MCH1942103.1 cation diffusion facilitator family transporter [Holdemania massiliensis]
MTEFLIKKFVKNYTLTEDAKVREHYGRLSSLTGIACNVLLFAVKLVMGTIAHSISITSDAFNNLSDSASCLVTLFGYKLAAKPADKDHPFGHGRIEYLTSLILASVILIVGFELLRGSVMKVIHPEAVQFSWIVLISLAASIGVKLWMCGFNRKLGRRIDSSVMLATAQDSLNDVIATSATVVSLVLSAFVSGPIDGIMGVVVSIFVLFSGYGIIKDTISELLGQPADKELVAKISEIMLSRQEILGLHDMMIHSYGPGNLIGSAHAEVSAHGDLLQIHDTIDEVEKEIYEQLHVMFTIHMDPIQTDNQEIEEARKVVKAILEQIDSRLSFHDFRMVSGPTHTNLIFDVVVPFECPLSFSDIREQINTRLSQQKQKWYTVITFDRDYIAE